MSAIDSTPTVAQMLGLPADWIVSMAPQGTQEWLNARRGVITGSRAKDACDFSDGMTDQQRTFVDARRKGKTEEEAMTAAGYKKAPSADVVAQAVAQVLANKEIATTPSTVALTYARDTALGRECPDWERDVYQTSVMRQGQEQEAFARRAYEMRTGYMVEAAGFVCTPDRKFGVSIDGLVYDEPEQRGGIEVKTLLGSNVIFDVLIGGDISEYVHQCQLNIWAWNLDWIDLCLWAPDLPVAEARLKVIRLQRDQDFIDDMLDKLVRFDRLVESCAQALRGFLAGVQPGAALPEAPPWDDAATPAAAPAEQPAAARVDLTEPAF
ncbi:MAG TPA: YqaJ viral recombinase family protein [Roseateles sp.]